LLYLLRNWQPPLYFYFFYCCALCERFTAGSYCCLLALPVVSVATNCLLDKQAW
jgi:hypothetical protein